jgi:hypothetical protein
MWAGPHWSDAVCRPYSAALNAKTPRKNFMAGLRLEQPRGDWSRGFLQPHLGERRAAVIVRQKGVHIKQERDRRELDESSNTIA